jgi:Caspase domain
MKTLIIFFMRGLLVIPCRLSAQSPAAGDPLLRGHALLIGVYQYEDRRWPTLDDIPIQISKIKYVLNDHCDTVEVIENKNSKEIWQKIDSFLRENGNYWEGRLLIYYAGHGYNERIDQFNTFRGYITGTDTPAIVKRTKSEYDAARLKSISMNRIKGPLEEILARQVLVILDNCFSGTIFNTRSVNQPRPLTPETVDFLMGKMARNLITAGGATERIPAHSPLPDLFLNAIEGAADNYGHGVVSASEIGNYLRDQLIQRQHIRLTPQEGPLEGEAFAAGEFLFRVIPKPTRAQPDVLSAVRLVELALNYRDGRGGLTKDEREATDCEVARRAPRFSCEGRALLTGDMVAPS